MQRFLIGLIAAAIASPSVAQSAVGANLQSEYIQMRAMAKAREEPCETKFPQLKKAIAHYRILEQQNKWEESDEFKQAVEINKKNLREDSITQESCKDFFGRFATVDK